MGTYILAIAKAVKYITISHIPVILITAIANNTNY